MLMLAGLAYCVAQRETSLIALGEISYDMETDGASWFEGVNCSIDGVKLIPYLSFGKFTESEVHMSHTEAAGLSKEGFGYGYLIMAKNGF